jgi:hypothetical protein
LCRKNGRLFEQASDVAFLQAQLVGIRDILKAAPAAFAEGRAGRFDLAGRLLLKRVR